MFEDYATGMGAAYDEMFEADSELRTPYSQLQPSLQQMGSTELQTRVEALQSSYLDQGVTFDIGGEERAFPLDILPRVIDDASWSTIEKGVRQRVATLAAQLTVKGDLERPVQALSGEPAFRPSHQYSPTRCHSPGSRSGLPTGSDAGS